MVKVGGLRHNKGKPKVSLVPPEIIMAVAKGLTANCESGKYPPRNWELGMAYSDVYDSLQRHLLKWWSGEDMDEEGLPHLYLAACNIAFLVTYHERDVGIDDRPKQQQKEIEPEKETDEELDKKNQEDYAASLRDSL